MKLTWQRITWKKHVRDCEHRSWCFMLFYKQLLSPIGHNIDVWMHYWKAITERSAKWHVLLATPRTVVRLREEQSSIILSCITKPVKLESGSAWLSGEKNPMTFVYTRGHGKKASEYFPSSLNALCRHIPCSDVYHYESTDSKCIKMCWALKINVCNCVYIDLQTATAAFITGINIVFFILNGCWLICKKQPEIISCWELVIFMNMRPCLRWQNWEKVNFMQQCKVSLLYS